MKATYTCFVDGPKIPCYVAALIANIISFSNYTFSKELRVVDHMAWDDIPQEVLTSKIGRRMVTGEQVMLAIIDLKEGAVVPSHSHHNEQITYVVSGCLRFTMGDQSVIDVRAGETLVIPPNVEHAAVALEDTIDIDCFSPPRADWLSGEDAYLRGDDAD